MKFLEVKISSDPLKAGADIGRVVHELISKTASECSDPFAYRQILALTMAHMMGCITGEAGIEGGRVMLQSLKVGLDQLEAHKATKH